MHETKLPQYLGHNFSFANLYTREGLISLDSLFLDSLKEKNKGLYDEVLTFRQAPHIVQNKAYSSFIFNLAPVLEEFIADLFNIEHELNYQSEKHLSLSPLFHIKRNFVIKKASRHKDSALIAQHDQTEFETIKQKVNDVIKFADSQFEEVYFAQKLAHFLKDESSYQAEIQTCLDYCAFALFHPQGQAFHKKDVLFQIPQKTDESQILKKPDLKQRYGFNLTDEGLDLKKSLGQAHYCIFCHHQERDSCSKGLKEKNSSEFQKNQHNITLTGCPLEEKISEMNELKSQAYILSSLAVVTIDNPLCAATGHRICNDCMKSCIYQKQDPVNIPQIESQILKDVLDLPYGAEIYSLLTRWNPMNIHRPYPKEKSGYKILVVGAGPAGFNLCHHLLQEGHEVVLIDGLKIEPLPCHLSGHRFYQEYLPIKPIVDYSDIKDNLSERIVGGFGGVAEYGITVRWDKNYLKLIRILLERQNGFYLIGGVRFGGTLTEQQAFDYGFDHIALCLGAGKPRFVEMKNAFVPGVRMASDFLMNLQLTGAAKENSLANLEIRLPVAVIGGGLTAVDTATEAMAYYAIQVEKFYARYQKLVSHYSEDYLRSSWTEAEQNQADIFLLHGKQIAKEKQLALKEHRAPDIQKLLLSWGGARLIYRQNLKDAPSYRLNHEELDFAFEEGVEFCENLIPREVITGPDGHAKILRCEHRLDKTIIDIKASTILVAAGTQPNTILAQENSKIYKLDHSYFELQDEEGHKASAEKLAKPNQTFIHIYQTDDQRYMSQFGDLHPSFAGNVVKAMASAKKGYPLINNVLFKRTPVALAKGESLSKLAQDLQPTIHQVKRLTSNIIEVVIKAPYAARAFQPGQFYRVQNFESFAPHLNETTFAMEGIALTGAWVDKEQGLISTIALEMGGSSQLLSLLKQKEKIILMGPTGTPTHIPTQKNVCLVGGGLGNAVLFSIGQACRAQGCHVTYFAGYKKKKDRYKIEEIEKAADQIIWCTDEPVAFETNPNRPQDQYYTGNIVQALEFFAPTHLPKIDEMIVIGSDTMMAAVSKALRGSLKPYTQKDLKVIASINSPMQCMMKEICAQCIQLHKDPETGEEKVVFSCANQDQDIFHVDFDVLKNRLKQNTLSEKLTASWINYCLEITSDEKLYKRA